MDEADHPLGVAPQPPPTRRRTLTLSIVIVVGLLGFAWVSYWSQRTPAVLDAAYDAMLDPGPERGPLLVGVTAPASEPGHANISLVEVEPVIGRNDADAEISFLVCAPKGGEVVGFAVEPIDDYCERTRPAEDTTLQVAGEYLVMVIAPARAGVVRVDAVDVTYRRGWQLLYLPKTQTVAVSARMKVT